MTDAFRIPLGRPAGVPLSADVGVPVVSGFVFWMLWSALLPVVSPDAGPWWRAGAAGLGTLAYIGSVLLHEVGHAVMARRNGVGVLAITLWFFGGAAHLDRPAPTPRAEFQIALAGPLTNLALAGVFGVGAVMSGGWRGAGLAGLFTWLTGINLVFAATNLLPGAPLDGGRVLAAALWRRHGRAELARLQAARAGLLIGSAIAVVGIVVLRRPGSPVGWPTLVFGVIVALGALSEIKRSAVRRRLEERPLGEVMVTHPPLLDPDATVDDFLNSGLAFGRPVGRQGESPLGFLTDSMVATISGPDRSWTLARTVMIGADSVCRAWSTETVGAVINRSGEPEPPHVIVVHDPADGRVVGTYNRYQAYRLMSEPVDRWGRDRSPSGGSKLARLAPDDR